MPMSDLFFHSLCELSDISEYLLLMFSFDISCCALMLNLPAPRPSSSLGFSRSPSLTYSCHQALARWGFLCYCGVFTV